MLTARIVCPLCQWTGMLTGKEPLTPERVRPMLEDHLQRDHSPEERASVDMEAVAIAFDPQWTLPAPGAAGHEESDAPPLPPPPEPPKKP